MSINRVVISGNLTRDPELRTSAGGTGILSFGMAVNDRRRNAKTGEWEDYPDYIDCVIFGARADALSKILTKGMKVSLEGKLRWSQWEKDGQKRSKIEVFADEVDLMQRSGSDATSRAQQASGTSYADQPKNTAQTAPQRAYEPATSIYDEDIPF